MKKLLKPDEARKILGIGKNKMYGLLRQGIIPSVKLGHRTFVPTVFVDNLLNGETKNG